MIWLIVKYLRCNIKDIPQKLIIEYSSAYSYSADTQFYYLLLAVLVLFLLFVLPFESFPTPPSFITYTLKDGVNSMSIFF